MMMMMMMMMMIIIIIIIIEGETKSEIIAAQDQALQTKYHTTKYYQQKQIANAECVNNLMRQCNTSYQHAQYWQKNNT